MSELSSMSRLWAVPAALSLIGSSWAQPDADSRAIDAYRSLLAVSSRTELQAEIGVISGLGSRLAGSAGERLMLEYAERRFRQMGLSNLRREPFTVTVPDPDATGTLSGSGWTARVLPLWPNLVRTSTCDVSGPLIYGRSGSLRHLQGKEISGSIVLLEFDSGSNWKNAFKLGAKAVVFVEPETMDRTEAEAKFSSAPLDAPRFYLPLEQAGSVLTAAFRKERARLKCRQDWVTQDTYNLLADLPGTDADLRGERIVVAAPADAMSVVPFQAPGASGACSVSVLLHLAREAVRAPGRRPMTFALVSGNGLALQGFREYAERRIREGRPTFLAVTLDLSDGSGNVGAFGRGWFIDYRNESLDPLRNLARSLRAHADRMAPLFSAPTGRHVLLDTVNDSDGRIWRNTVYGKFALGCEPLVMAGMNALSFATVEIARQRHDTPFDTVERLDIQDIDRQAKILSCLFWHLTRDTSRPGELSSHKVPVSLRVPTRHSLTGGFSVVEGQVAQFDPNKSFIADEPVPSALAVSMHASKTMSGVRGPMVQSVDPSDARFRFLGLPPSSAFFHLEPRVTTLAAYALKPATGQIEMGPTEELLGHRFDASFQLTTSYRSIPIVVFPCVAVSLYDLVDPQELVPLYSYAVLDPQADAAPRNSSMALPAYDPKRPNEFEPNAVLFMERGAKYKLLMGTGSGEWRLVLSGSTPATPAGEGYEAVEGAFPQLPFAASRDLIAINDSRLEAFARYRILSPGLSDLQEGAKEALDDASAATAAQNWPRAERSSRAAWALALRAHPMIQKTVSDVVNGVLFYLALLIPFSYFLERLLFARKSLTSQLFASIAIFVAAFLLLRAIHPAFEIVSNPTMIFVAFVMGALSVLVTTFIVGKFEASLRDLRARQTGLGHIDVGRMSVAMSAFNLGIANMRRRKARTFLTTLTLVVMTFIVLSFTSIVPGLSIAEQPSEHEAIYPGILVRNPGLEPLTESGCNVVANEFEGSGIVVRRAWYYGLEVGDSPVLTLSNSSSTVDVRAAAGFESEEIEVSRVKRALLPGGRWFRPDDFRHALLPFSVAERLHIGAADVGKAQIEFAGRRVTVIGILSESSLSGTLDLDGESILPADFSLSKKYQTESGSSSQAFRKYLRLDPSTVFFVPLEFVRTLGGEVRSMAVRLPSASQTRTALESLMPRLRKNLYAAVTAPSGLEVRQFSVLQRSKSAGLGLVLVQMLIASVFVLNTMMASVYERKREIGIFSSIGLAPNHISILFFAESSVYGVLGAVIGYLLAQGVSRAVIQTGLVPGLYLNLSATSAVLAAGIVLAIVLLSTVFPARVAGKIAAPAYESDVASEPEGDQWSILLPFRVGKADAGELMVFFKEWFEGHREHALGDFVTSETALTSSQGQFGQDEYHLISKVWLAPFDLGVSQLVTIVALPGPANDIVELRLVLERLSGEPENWITVNRRFLVSIRRRFLAWRTKPKSIAPVSGSSEVRA